MLEYFLWLLDCHSGHVRHKKIAAFYNNWQQKQKTLHNKLIDSEV